MKLSDIVSAMHLTIFAEVPLLIFMGIFIGVAAHLFGKREHFSEIGALPLRDEGTRQRRGRS
jgi:cbb3-type cytochrome oxidase subunit 3